jgi:hypothetical protein
MRRQEQDFSRAIPLKLSDTTNGHVVIDWDQNSLWLTAPEK